MSVFLFLIPAIIAIQNGSTPSISTPDLPQQVLERQSLQRNSLRSAEIAKPLLSSKLYEPTIVDNASVESYDKVRSRFDSMTVAAQAEQASSFTDIRQKILVPQGCYIVGEHPAGVKRIIDGKYNGIAILMDCGSVFYNIEHMDFSQKLEQDITKELSEKFYAINGGYVSQSIAKSSDGRFRRDFTAIGNTSSVDAVAQSKNAMETTSDDVRRDLLIIESLLAS